MSDSDLSSLLRLTELADYTVPVAIRVACELGVADQLSGGPQPVEALAQATGAHAPSLQRLLRALCRKGIFCENEPGSFALTPMAELLRSDHPMSLRGAFPLLADDLVAWSRFDHSVSTGEPAFQAAHGRRYWERLAERPESVARFHGAAESQARLELRLVLRVYDVSRFATVVDVGGGSGAFLAGLLARHPEMRGVVFDRPEVSERARRYIDEAKLTERCRFVGGSFFDGVPPGGDAYLLKSVLCDWDDEPAGVLLDQVARALAPSGRVIVLEPLLDAGPVSELSARYDLRLLAMTGTRLRTRSQLEALLGRAGLAVTGMVETLMFPLVEAQRR